MIPALLFNKKNLVGNMARKKLPPNNVIASCPGFSGIDGLIIILEEMKLNELVVNQVFFALYGLERISGRLPLVLTTISIYLQPFLSIGNHIQIRIVLLHFVLS